nr:immunoglobulin light chain junction region [Macaca mulatta]MPN92289.1 immunoglobulin light chain junction region [Macaca mulatta]MPN96150.1 immunoglobulin light chain junction region [Macaca mulatta]MPO01621.1 immunoglobulin light chain junction region [Macaca mulatta]
CQQESNWSTF